MRRSSLDEGELFSDKKKLGLRASDPIAISKPTDFEVNSFRGSLVFSDFNLPRSEGFYSKGTTLVRRLFSKEKPKKSFEFEDLKLQINEENVSNNSNNNNNNNNNDNKEASRLTESGEYNILNKSNDRNCTTNEEQQQQQHNFESFSTEKVLFFQSLIRTINLKQTIIQYGQSSEREEAQNEALKELIENEQKYVELLQIIVETYIHPLKKKLSKAPILSAADINSLFFNYEELYNYHKSFLRLIEIKRRNWPVVNLSKYLDNHFKQILQLYENFAPNLMNSDKTYSQICSKRNFKRFLNQRSVIYQLSFTPSSFRALLSYPSKHIAAYEYLSKRILFNTFMNCTNFRRLRDCVATITQFSKFIHENIEYNDCHQISSLLHNKLDLCAGQRRQFIKDTPLLVNDFKKVAILFSDLLLLTSKKGKRRLRLDETIHLKDAQLTSIRKTVDNKKIYFVIQYFKQTFECEEDGKYKTSFAKTLNDQVKLASDPIFGVPLDDLLAKEKATIPSIIVKTTFYIDKLANKAGLFRTIGNPSIIAGLRISESSPKGNDYAICHRDDIASLLAVFLELLPDPIINFNPFDPIYTKNRELLNEEMIMREFLEKVIKSMSTNTRNLIEYIAYFLQRLSSSGLLSTLELSLFFAPLIIRSVESSIEYCHSMPIVLRLFDTLIQKSDLLFTTEENIRLPNNIEDFFNSDSFGPWWKSFRSKDSRFVQFITSDESIKQLYSHLIAIDSYLQTGSSSDPLAQQLLRYSSLSANVLASDWISIILFDKVEYLSNLFDLFKSLKFELTRRYFIDIFQSFFTHYHSKKVIDFLLSNNNNNADNDDDRRNYLLLFIDQIHSGNISKFLEKIVELSSSLSSSSSSSSSTTIQSQHFKLLTIWAIASLKRIEVLLFEEDEVYNKNVEMNSIIIMNLSEFLTTVLMNYDYMKSAECLDFLQCLFNAFEFTSFYDQSLHRGSHICAYITNILIAIITKPFTSHIHDHPLLNLHNGNASVSNTWTPDTLRDEADKIEDDSTDQMKEELFVQYTPRNEDQDEESPLTDLPIKKKEIIDSVSEHLSNDQFIHTSLYKLFVLHEKEDADHHNHHITLQSSDFSPSFLTKLIASHSQIASILRDKNRDLLIKLTFLQLIQALIIINSQLIIDFLPSTEIFNSCIDVVRSHPRSNVLHCVVRDIFMIIFKTKRKNNNSSSPSPSSPSLSHSHSHSHSSSLISHLINSTQLLPLLFEATGVSKKENLSLQDHFFCHARMIISSIVENEIALKLILDCKFHKLWNKMIPRIVKKSQEINVK